MSIVTLTTDFGTTDPFVGIMKGVLASRAPAATVIDLTHGIPPQDVLAGALVLRHSLPYFPSGAIHVAVVDPGVGSARRPLCVVTSGGLLVGPDNGLLSLAAPAAEVRRIVHLTDERFFLAPRSHTFHGRDVFAPVAAALATGTEPAHLGPEVKDLERLTLPSAVTQGDRVQGQVIYVDHFGNLVTNVPEQMLTARTEIVIAIRDARIRGVAPSYGAGQGGEPLAVVNSWGLLEIAVRHGSARTVLGAAVGEPVTIEPQR
jgi:S-adenosylmethionine hydrolase